MTTHSSWNERTTSKEVMEAFGPVIQGKTVLITGVSPDGIGEGLAVAIASASPRLIIITGRTPAKSEIVAKKLSCPVKIIKLDVASFASCREAAAQVKDNIDLLMNNAGIANIWEKKLSPDGIEMQLATNHLGSFLFTSLLLPRMNPGCRVTATASNGHILSGFRFHDWNFDDPSKLTDEEKPNKEALDGWFLPYKLDYSSPVAYGQSKTATILFHRELPKRAKHLGIQGTSAHPGGKPDAPVSDYGESCELTAPLAIKTPFWDSYPPEQREELFKVLPFKTMDEGVATMLVAALDPKLAETPGAFITDCQVLEPEPHAKSSEAAAKLWTASEEIVGSDFRP